jgi:hypothetical protein
MELGADVVRVEGAKGKPATDSYKVSIAYRDGWTATGTLVICAGAGVDPEAKARQCGEIILQRLRRAGIELARTHLECLGAGDVVPGMDRGWWGPVEVVLRLSAHDERRAAVERFTKEFAPLVTSGPPGVTGYLGGRPPVREVFAYWPALLSKTVVEGQAALFGAGGKE